MAPAFRLMACESRGDIGRVAADLGMDMSRLTSFAAAGIAAFALLSTPAWAQDQPAAAAASDAPPEPPGWIKQCTTAQQTPGKDGCQTARDLRDQTGQVVASVALRDEKSSGKHILALAVPPGLQIQPGIRVLIDDQTPINARYTICYPQACVVEADASDAVVSAMKKGKVLVIQAVTVTGQGATFPVTLPGFGKAYDGEPISNDDLAKVQKDWSDKMILWLQAHPPKPAAAAPQQ